MSVWELDPGLAMGTHANTSKDVAALTGKRQAVRNEVHGAASAAWDENIPEALHGFWNSHAAPQAQAAASTASNALRALDAVVANYLAADYEAAAISSAAADAIPRNVTHIDDSSDRAGGPPESGGRRRPTMITFTIGRGRTCD